MERCIFLVEKSYSTGRSQIARTDEVSRTLSTGSPDDFQTNATRALRLGPFPPSWQSKLYTKEGEAGPRKMVAFVRKCVEIAKGNSARICYVTAVE